MTERRTHLDGETGSGLFTVLVTVHPFLEGEGRCCARPKIQIVVEKLAPLHEHDRAELVLGELVVGEADQLVGHLPDLQQGGRQADRMVRRGQGKALSWAAQPRADLDLLTKQLRSLPRAEGSQSRAEFQSSRGEGRCHPHTAAGATWHKAGWRPPRWGSSCNKPGKPRLYVRRGKGGGRRGRALVSGTAPCSEGLRAIPLLGKGLSWTAA